MPNNVGIGHEGLPRKGPSEIANITGKGKLNGFSRLLTVRALPQLLLHLAAVFVEGLTFAIGEAVDAGDGDLC